jgi:hypothetical protein
MNTPDWYDSFYDAPRALPLRTRNAVLADGPAAAAWMVRVLTDEDALLDRRPAARWAQVHAAHLLAEVSEDPTLLLFATYLRHADQHGGVRCHVREACADELARKPARALPLVQRALSEAQDDTTRAALAELLVRLSSEDAHMDRAAQVCEELVEADLRRRLLGTLCRARRGPRAPDRLFAVAARHVRQVPEDADVLAWLRDERGLAVLAELLRGSVAVGADRAERLRACARLKRVGEAFCDLACGDDQSEPDWSAILAEHLAPAEQGALRQWCRDAGAELGIPERWWPKVLAGPHEAESV